MENKRNLRDWYLEGTEEILKKLRYTTNQYDKDTWKMFKWETILLVVYHMVSLATMGIPTPVSLLLNTLMVCRFIIGNHRENKKLVNKRKSQKKSAKNEYTSMQAMIAIGEGIVIILMAMMLLFLGIDNNIGQKEFATFIIVCISFFEGWKDINVGFFGATPQTF